MLYLVNLCLEIPVFGALLSLYSLGNYRYSVLLKLFILGNNQYLANFIHFRKFDVFS